VNNSQLFHHEVAADLRGRLRDWRGLWEGSVGEARQMLRLLINDRLTARPVERGYEFSGSGTVEPILAGIAPCTTHLRWRPQAFRVGTRSQPSCNRCSGYVIRWDSRRDRTVLGLPR
jgi:hypothetical protein